MSLLRADALRIPLADGSVDLIVTSPPYFGQRAYTDGGEIYPGQLGSEPHPQDFLEAMWAATAECWRVLKPTGSAFFNFGDKRSGSGAPGTTSGLGGNPQGDRTGMTEGPRDPVPGHGHPDRRTTRGYNRAAFGRPKSRQMLPQRWAIGCEDGLADPAGIGWILRQEIIWHKTNGMPEPVADRTRDSHEYWYHLVKQGDYFTALDEIREPHSGDSHPRRQDETLSPKLQRATDAGIRKPGGWYSKTAFHPLGRPPGSVWTVTYDRVTWPEHLQSDEHFAAFPAEWPQRLILGWSPHGICTACDEGRRPVAVTELVETRPSSGERRARRQDARRGPEQTNGWNGDEYPKGHHQVTSIDGYECGCPEPAAPTRPAVVLDPFVGTGTTAAVAGHLGRLGVGCDLSRGYLERAAWRLTDPKLRARVLGLDPPKRPPPEKPGQLDLLGAIG
jgi:DNA modification methylase